MDNVKQQTILALDLGTITGFAIKDQSGVIIFGVASFHNKRFEGGGMVFLRFKQWLTELKNSTTRPSSHKPSKFPTKYLLSRL